MECNLINRLLALTLQRVLLSQTFLTSAHRAALLSVHRALPNNNPPSSQQRNAQYTAKETENKIGLIQMYNKAWIPAQCDYMNKYTMICRRDLEVAA